MKVIFLDMDGVMNSRSSRTQRYKKNPKDEEWDFPCQPMIENLNMIIEATGAKVVISSSWRHFHSLESLDRIFKHVSIKCEIIGETPKNSLACTRGTEIAEYLKDKNDIERYVILDDDSDMKPVARYFIQTSDLRGLEKKHALKAIRILMGD